ncbi:MAG: PKD domain-containing protein [Bacteroidia bacterium]
MKAQLLFGTSPFQDSMWAIDTTTWSIQSRMAPSLSGFTITGITGMAYDPVGHQTYVIMKVSGVTGRVLGTIDPLTGVCTQVGNLGTNFATISFRNDGQLYGVTGNGAQPNPETLFKIDKTTGVPTLAIALGNGADGEIISYNGDDDMFYHWSGNGTVVFEKFPSQPPYTPVTNIPISGTAGGETFGAIYLGNNDFIISNIASTIKHLNSNGTYASNTLMSLPDDLRGLAMPPLFFIDKDTVCPQDLVKITVKNAGFARDTTFYQWGDGNTTALFPASDATHGYTTPGNYTVAVVMKNDTVGMDTLYTFPMRVQNAPLVALTPGNDTTICDMDSLVIAGTSGGTLQWYMNGLPIVGATGTNYTAMTAGVYNQLKTNLNGCSDSASVGILVKFGDYPVADLGPDSTICDGDSLCFTLSNPSGVTYAWSNGSTASVVCATTAGMLSVLAIDSVGCRTEDSVNVSVILMPNPAITADTSNCPSIAFLSNDQNGTSWSWTFGDGGTSTSQNPSHTYTANGSYVVTVVADNSCFTGVSTSFTVDINCLVAVKDAFLQGLSIAPNPSNGKFILNAVLPEAGNLHYSVTDLAGRTIFIGGNDDLRTYWNVEIDLQAAAGTYMLTVSSGEHRAAYRISIQ